MLFLFCLLELVFVTFLILSSFFSSMKTLNRLGKTSLNHLGKKVGVGEEFENHVLGMYEDIRIHDSE